VKRIMDTAEGMAGVAVALIVTGLALAFSPVIAYVMWRNDRKRARR
jgi:hypothetical protein